MKKLRIGIASQQYLEKRNIIDVVESADYLLCRDWFTLKSRLKQLPVLKGSFGYNLYDEFSFNDFGLNRVDGFHFFNHIAYMAKPWICTFETLIPRYKNTLYNFTDSPERAVKDENVAAGVAALALSHCKKLIAIPEINNETCGWLIEVPKNGLGESKHHTKEELKSLSACIREGISYILKSIEADPAQIKTKGSSAFERIKQDHCPKQYSNKIRCIYELFFS